VFKSEHVVVVGAVKQLKRTKSADPDGVAREHLKWGT